MKQIDRKCKNTELINTKNCRLFFLFVPNQYSQNQILHYCWTNIIFALHLCYIFYPIIWLLNMFRCNFYVLSCLKSPSLTEFTILIELLMIGIVFFFYVFLCNSWEIARLYETHRKCRCIAIWRLLTPRNREEYLCKYCRSEFTRERHLTKIAERFRVLPREMTIRSLDWLVFFSNLLSQREYFSKRKASILCQNLYFIHIYFYFIQSYNSNSKYSFSTKKKNASKSIVNSNKQKNTRNIQIDRMNRTPNSTV